MITLPVQLDDTDISIIKSLMEDGRKSFRAIAREIKTSSPTVKARYQRLVEMGLIKSVRLEIDLTKIDRNTKVNLGDNLESLRTQKKHFHVYVEGLKVKLKCDFCGGPVHDTSKKASCNIVDSYDRRFMGVLDYIVPPSNDTT